MKTARQFLQTLRLVLPVVAVGMLVAPGVVHAQGKKKNPTSKVYFSDVNGEAQIDTGDLVQDLSKRTVYSAQGTVIETKKDDPELGQTKNYSTMVYSNGTGAFFDADTRVEVKQFDQEPFTPNRADIDVEPSISQTQAFVARGTVGLCTSKLVAGSNMTYNTAHGSVNIQGRKVVIEAGKNLTKIAMLEGESTVRAGAMDMGGHVIRAGEQAVIRSGGMGQPNIVEITKIPDNELGNLDEKVAMACMAKKTVYFEVKERPAEAGGAAAGAAVGDSGSAVTAFDDPGTAVTPIREIVPVQVVPTTLPVEYTLTPARVPSPSQPGG